METTAAPNNAPTSDRIDQFRNDVADMNLKAGNAGMESALLIIGVVLMIVGIVIGFLSWIQSRNLGDPRDIQTAIVLTLTGVTLSIFGAALFLRYSIAKFLRMWLLRNLYEGQANTDRIVDAVSHKG